MTTDHFLLCHLLSARIECFILVLLGLFYLFEKKNHRTNKTSLELLKEGIEHRAYYEKSTRWLIEFVHLSDICWAPSKPWDGGPSGKQVLGPYPHRASHVGGVSPETEPEVRTVWKRWMWSYSKHCNQINVTSDTWVRNLQNKSIFFRLKYRL